MIFFFVKAQHKYPTDSQMMLQALAGPMSPKEADLFYQQMKTPPVPKHYQRRLSDKKMTPKKLLESRLSDIDKGRLNEYSGELRIIIICNLKYVFLVILKDSSVWVAI